MRNKIICIVIVFLEIWLFQGWIQCIVKPIDSWFGS